MSYEDNSSAVPLSIACHWTPIGSYQLGDEVKVKVLKVDVLRNQIDLEVVPAEESDEQAAPLPVAVSDS